MGAFIIRNYTMNKTESYIEAVTEYMARPRKVTDMSARIYDDIDHDEFRLEGHRFIVMEAEFSNVMTLTKTRLITVRPAEFPDMDALNVAYEPDFWSRTDDSDLRIEACYRLATKFVNDMLPKVDYRFRIQLHNDEVERLLEEL